MKRAEKHSFSANRAAEPQRKSESAAEERAEIDCDVSTRKENSFYRHRRYRDERYR